MTVVERLATAQDWTSVLDTRVLDGRTEVRARP